MQRVYLDSNASSKIRPEVVDVIATFLREGGGNPSSLHWEGRRARAWLGKARRQVAELIHAEPDEILFTSGGTESNNLALKGVLFGHPNPHFITTNVEHPSVLEVCRRLEKKGVEVTYLSASMSDKAGGIACNELRRAIRPNTVLISIQWANNETGIIQPIEEMAAVAKEEEILFHTDAVQAAGKIDIDVRKAPVDLLTLSGHKIGAPAGVGALYVRGGTLLEPLFHGSPQERKRRAGTEALVQIVAFGAAAQLAKRELPELSARLTCLRQRMEGELLQRLDRVSIQGRERDRLPTTMSLTVEGVAGDTLLMALDLEGISVSLGSACTSGTLEPSHVLLAMGLPGELAASTVRVSLGWHNTDEEIDRFIETFMRVVKRLRATALRRGFSTRPAASLEEEKITADK